MMDLCEETLLRRKGRRMFVINQNNFEIAPVKLRFNKTSQDYINTLSTIVSTSIFEITGKCHTLLGTSYNGARTSAAPYYGFGTNSSNKWYAYMGGLLFSSVNADTNDHVFSLRTNDGLYIDSNLIYNLSTAGITTISDVFYICKSNQTIYMNFDISEIKIYTGATLLKRLVGRANGAFQDTINNVWYYNRESVTNQYPLTVV